MTWIVGMSAALGYSAAISDVQVSWNGGVVTHDCLQKVHPIRPCLAAGFAGSVQLGFMLLDDLKCCLAPGYCYPPLGVAYKWWRRARRIFENAAVDNKRLGCTLMLLGVRPTQNSGNTRVPIADLITLDSRTQFAPVLAQRATLVSIGSGNSNPQFVQALDELRADPYALVTLETGHIGNAATVMGFVMSDACQSHPTHGVSGALQKTIVSRQGTLIEPLDVDDLSVPNRSLPFPRIADNWNEFQQISRELGMAAAEASA